MKKKILIIIAMTAILAAAVAAQETPTADEILDRIDKNMVFTTAYSEVDMIITTPRRTVTKSMISYSKGTQRALMEFLSPARDKGTKILRIDDMVNVYYPSAERVMRLSGHMLRRSMMGSDFSFEDMTERAKKMREEYSAEIKGEEEFDGRACYIIVMTSKIQKQTYFVRKSWVDKERYIGLKEELYAKSGKLLKVMSAHDIKTIGKRFYPLRITLEDKLRKNTKTEIVMKKIEFDVDIPESTFSERRLMKK